MDLTHKHPFTYQSLDYCLVNSKLIPINPLYHEYGKMKFILASRKINFYRLHNLLGIGYFANKFPLFFESYLAGIFNPCEVEFVLKAVK